MRRLVGIVGGFLLAAIVVLVGPKETTLCTMATWPNSALGDRFGHVDGEMFTGCVVPTGATWAVAGAAVATPIAASIAITIDRRRRA